MSISYAQNLLSSVNVTLEALRENRGIRISPSKAVGQRSNIRTQAPASLNREKISQVTETLRNLNHPVAAAVIEVAREFGLREREAVLMNYSKALTEARKIGQINITEGTKGGRGHRNTERLVPVSSQGKELLEKVVVLQGDKNNLIATDKNWIQTNNELHGQTIRNVFKEAGIKGFHEARSAYACERYKQETGKNAPVVTGQREASKKEDMDARFKISAELGHGRFDVLISYIGSSK